MAKLAIHGGEAVNAKGHTKYPVVSLQDKEYVMKALDEGILWGAYAPQVKALEKEWAEYVGTKYCLSCDSGTAAIDMALMAAGIGPGDEVLSPSLNFVAAPLAVLQCNAIPTFVDVDPRTFCMDPKKIEAKITKRTKAIIPVDLHGIVADMDEINAIAKKYNLIVIADSCQSHGATYKGKNIGTLADMSVFSLNGPKNLTCGEGGLLYAALAETGYFPKSELKTVKCLNSRLQGHPDYRKTPGVEANTGSLGQGISIGLGMSLGVKLDGYDSKIYVLVGDGEICEGQIWEAVMAATHYHADNLVVILDKNRFQATGAIVKRFNNEPTVSKWSVFGWNTIEIDGHNMEEILTALEEADSVKGKPTVIVANTVKGKGISFAENNAAYHNGIFTEETYHQALKELN